jgi:hypothetical protein
MHSAKVVLGRVDKPDPDTNAAEQNKAQKAAGCMVVAGGNATTVLEAIDEPLDAVAHGVGREIDGMLVNRLRLVGISGSPPRARTSSRIGSLS